MNDYEWVFQHGIKITKKSRSWSCHLDSNSLYDKHLKTNKWYVNMKGATPELLSLLQRRPANIRNICILAHVDHGKKHLFIVQIKLEF